jgi:catechol 2,3-dioxygenase-like lactoylglutathione lyase family enzyme
MNSLTDGVISLRPFVPAKDFELSKRYYFDLGFSLVYEHPNVAGLALGSHEFLLQNYYVEEWAGNFMMHLLVSDVEAWWAFVQTLDLPGKYGVPPANPPKEDEVLKVFHLIDPSGVLWHVAQPMRKTP